MGRMVEMDDRMDAKGFLRLCTRQKYLRMMGNAISPEVEALAQEMGFKAEAAALKERRTDLLARMMQFKLIRYPVQRVVNMLYKWLNL